MRRSLLLSTVVMFPCAILATPAAAQTVTLAEPPARLPVDEHGVNLSSGAFVAPSSALKIGDDDSGLVHTRFRVNDGWRHNYMIAAYEQGSKVTISIGGSSVIFTRSGSTFSNDLGSSETLTETSTLYIFTTAAGVVYTLEKQDTNDGFFYYGVPNAIGISIVSPGGERTDLHYRHDSYIKMIKFDVEVEYAAVRLQSVTSNTGYQLKFDYVANNFTNTSANNWLTISKVTGINNAIEYCAPLADACGLSGSWPSLAYATTASGSDKLETVTDGLSQQTRYRSNSSGKLTGIKRPSETNDGKVIAYDSNSRVSSITYQGSYARTYSWSTPSTGILQSTSTDSLGRTRIVKTDTAQSVIKEVEDANNNKTIYAHDSKGRVTSITAPEGNAVQLSYVDAQRALVTQERHIAKSGSGLTNIVTSAVYPTSCSNPVTCNKPTSTTDARGNSTNYTWDATHGGLTSVRLPADAAGVRPETRVSYSQTTARYLVGPSSYANSGAIYRPSSISQCASGTAPSCLGTVQERRTELAYPSSATANNAQAISVTTKAGNNTLAATTSVVYDSLGRVASVDGPLPGTSDTAYTMYDITGQMTGRISPDPDGAGSLPHLATRIFYLPDGQVARVEEGTLSSVPPSSVLPSNWSAFTLSAYTENYYDAFGRPKVNRQRGFDHATVSLVHTSYDAAGRTECTAIRMSLPDPSQLPASACTPMTAGAAGADRISKNVYDAADRLLETWSGVGTSLQQVTVKRAYNPNGTVAYVQDANNNLTDYDHDGHDRVWKVSYPSKTTPGSFDNSDNQQVSYDAAGNILTHKTRRGETLTYAYDNLGRVVSKIVPERSGLLATHTRDVYYGYDLFGGLLRASFDNANGEGLTYSYDGLGRLASQNVVLDSTNRSVIHGYDSAGRLSAVTYPDGQTFAYTYDDLSRNTQITDPSGNWLSQFGYMPQGVLEYVDYPPGGTVNARGYYYDAAQRLSGLINDVGTANTYDVQWNFTQNPAGQITSETINNSAFSWDGFVDSDVGYTANGLNQITQANANSYCYDANGNLTADGTNVYIYDVENRMVAKRVQTNSDCNALAYNGNQLAWMRYDPLGRLYETGDVNGNVIRKFYDRDALINEYDASGNMLVRYVHGLSAGDDPLVGYSGSVVSMSTARFLYRDRKGSIVMQADSGGGSISRNTYDEYGVPGQGNFGRFQYTGQQWLPEAGLYYYKARMYSPTLGRFMQTDPIGYADGMNIYRYVGNDPVNSVDPTGLDEIVVTGKRWTPACFACFGFGSEGGTSSNTVNLTPGGGGGSAVSSETPQSKEQTEQDNCASSGINDLVAKNPALAKAIANIDRLGAANGREYGFVARTVPRMWGGGNVSIGPTTTGVGGLWNASKGFTVQNFLRLNGNAIVFHSHYPSERYAADLSPADISNGDGFGEAMSVSVQNGVLYCSRSSR